MEDLPLICSCKISSKASGSKNFLATSEVNASSIRFLNLSSLIQLAIGDGKPSFSLFATSFGNSAAAAVRKETLVSSPRIRVLIGIVAAKAATSLSTNGVRTSSELHILIRSALCKISNGNQVLISKYCICVISSLSLTSSKICLV